MVEHMINYEHVNFQTWVREGQLYHYTIKQMKTIDSTTLYEFYPSA